MPSRVLVVGGGRVGAYLARALKDGGVPHVVLKMSNRNRARVHAPGKTGPGKTGADDPTRTGATAIATHAGATCVAAYEDLPAAADPGSSSRRAHFDLVFVAVKTYALRAVREEMEAAGVTFDAVVLAHNGMVDPVFDPSLTARASMPQSWDIVKDDGDPCGYRMVVRNEDKPWVLPNTTSASASRRRSGGAGSAPSPRPISSTSSSRSTSSTASPTSSPSWATSTATAYSPTAV